MTLSPKAVQTARRNLAQRIERVLTKIDQEGRQPTARESHYVSIALDQLEADRHHDGEWTMLRAERDDIFLTPELPADARMATTAELRARLAELVGAP